MFTKVLFLPLANLANLCEKKTDLKISLIYSNEIMCGNAKELNSEFILLNSLSVLY